MKKISRVLSFVTFLVGVVALSSVWAEDAQTGTENLQGLSEGKEGEQVSNGAAEVPSDIQQLEDKFKEATGSTVADPIAGALLEPGEPGGTLEPSEKFSRIPVRPRMSDSNWQKHAGPMLNKAYKLKKSDTLWGISQRFFGNPYLWPKVWELNANFTNPHEVEPGVELQFNLGNPNQGPELAFKRLRDEYRGKLPLFTTNRPRKILDLIDENLRRQLASSQPPFQHFLFDSKVPVLGKLPRPPNPEKVFYSEGDTFKTDLQDGNYNVIRPLETGELFFKVYPVKWVGRIQARNGLATISTAYAEMTDDDFVTAKEFVLSPLALYETQLNPEERKKVKLLSIEEGRAELAATNNLIGVRFPTSDTGPRPGAIMTISDDKGIRATLLLLDRDRRAGTLWVVDSRVEVQNSDSID